MAEPGYDRPIISPQIWTECLSKADAAVAVCLTSASETSAPHRRSDLLNESRCDESASRCLIFPAGITERREVVGHGKRNESNCLTSPVPRGLGRPVTAAWTRNRRPHRGYRTVADADQYRTRRNRGLTAIAVDGDFRLRQFSKTR